MNREYNAPVSIAVYLGSGKKAEKLRENLVRAAGADSLSELIVRLLKKAAPELFTEVASGKK